MPKSLDVRKIVQLHKNPIKPNVSFGKKIFIPQNIKTETEEVNATLISLEKVLSAERVERRNFRLEAEWLPEIMRAKVTKRIGNIPSCIGYERQRNLYLLPEEALFLLEMNRLELLSNRIPFSIEQAYKVLSGDDVSLQQYRVYQNLLSQGFYTKRTSDNIKISTSDNHNLKKTDIENKRSNCEEQDLLDKEINEKLKNVKEGIDDDKGCCYNIYSTDKKLKNKIVSQSTDDELNTSNISTDGSSVLISLSGVDSVAFYQLQTVNFDLN